MSARKYYLGSGDERREVSRAEYLEDRFGPELAAFCEEGGYGYTGDSGFGDEPGLDWQPGARGIRLPDLDKRFPLRDSLFPEGPSPGVTAFPTWWMRKALEECAGLLPDLRLGMVEQYTPNGIPDAERLGSLRALLKEQIAQEEEVVLALLRRARGMLAAWEAETLYQVARSDADREQKMRRLKGWILGAAGVLWDKLLMGWHHVEIAGWCRQVMKEFSEVPEVFAQFQADGICRCAFERDRIVLGPAAMGLDLWESREGDEREAEAERLREMTARQPGALALEVRRLTAEAMLRAALKGQGMDAVLRHSYVFFGFEERQSKETEAALPEMLASIQDAEERVPPEVVDEAIRTANRRDVRLGKPSRKNDQWGPLLPFLAEAMRRAPGATKRRDLAGEFQKVCDEYEEAREHCETWGLDPASMNLDTLGDLRKRARELL